MNRKDMSRLCKNLFLSWWLDSQYFTDNCQVIYLLTKFIKSFRLAFSWNLKTHHIDIRDVMKAILRIFNEKYNSSVRSSFPCVVMHLIEVYLLRNKSKSLLCFWRAGLVSLSLGPSDTGRGVMKAILRIFNEKYNTLSYVLSRMHKNLWMS